MSLVAAWLLFPALALAVGTGCGLLLERAAGERMPGTLLPSAGLALVIVVATLATRRDLTAELASPAVLVLAVAGWALGWRRLRGVRLDGWALGASGALFAVLAAPVVLTGQATFLGYFMQNDTAIYFALVDHVMTHGRDLSGLEPSTYYTYLKSYIDTDYPLGTFVGLGALRPFTGQDVAWIYQPWLALLLALNGTALYEILRRAVPSAPLRAAAAFLAGQAALLYAYYLQSTGKETATAWVLAVTVALAFATLDGRRTWRSALPLAVVVAAGVDILNLAVAPWLLPPLAAFAAGLWWLRPRTGPRAAWLAPLAALGVAVVVLTGPVLAGGEDLPRHRQRRAHPERRVRQPPAPAGVVAGARGVAEGRLPAARRLAHAARLRAHGRRDRRRGAGRRVGRPAPGAGPLVLMGTALVAGVYLTRRGSPYADGKAMAIAAPAVVLAAMLGAAALVSVGRRVEGWLLAAADRGRRAMDQCSPVLVGEPRAADAAVRAQLDRQALRGTGDHPLPAGRGVRRALPAPHPFLLGRTSVREAESRARRAAAPPGGVDERALGRQRPLAAVPGAPPADRGPGATPLAARPPANYRLAAAGSLLRRVGAPVLSGGSRARARRGHEPPLRGVPRPGRVGRGLRAARDPRRAGPPPGRAPRLRGARRRTGDQSARHGPTPGVAGLRRGAPALGHHLRSAGHGRGGGRGCRAPGATKVWIQGRFDRGAERGRGGPPGNVKVRAARARPGRAGLPLSGRSTLPAGRTRIVVTRPGNDLAPGDAEVRAAFSGP